MTALASLTPRPSPLIDTLRLARTPGVGSITFHHLIARYGSPTQAIEALPELARRGGRKTALVATRPEDIEREIEATEQFGARFVTCLDDDYPTLLRQIPDAPPVLTILGNPQLWQRECIAIVGARNASGNGCNFTQKISRELGETGYTIVSGLARGIDAFAHKGALATGTIGVIAGGIDTIYPPENKNLYTEMEERGCIISEQPFGAAPIAQGFPARNRIIAGLSLATVVVEASPKSGSLITARLTLEYNRELCAVPGSPLDPRAQGCNQLLKNGAHLTEGADDVLAALRAHPAHTLEETPTIPYQTDRPITDSELAQARKIILEKLSPTPIGVDELLAQCHVAHGTLLTILLELELAGKIQRQPGNRVSLRVS